MFFQKNYKIPKIKREKNLHLEIYPDWLISELLLTKELEKVKRTGDTRPLKRIIRRRRDKQTRDKIRFKKKAEMSRRLRQEDQLGIGRQPIQKQHDKTLDNTARKHVNETARGDFDQTVT